MPIQTANALTARVRELEEINRQLAQANALSSELLAERELQAEQIDRLNRSLAEANARSSELLAELEERLDESRGLNAALQREVVERRNAEAALQRKATELKRSNAELEQFAYVASHDLQEPLRGVAGFAQLLSQSCSERLTVDEREYLGFVVSCAARMKRVIEDLLALARVSTRPYHVEQVDCAALVRRVVEGLWVAVRESGAEVSCGDLPTVPGDETQLSQLFQNLVGNALKFRSDQPPRVRIEAERGQGEWAFAVRDNGAGIATSDQERIFVIFQRAAGTGVPGSGIGLAVCKKIVERHGGRIWVESTPGQGSVFRFTLPEVAAASSNGSNA
jgi:light-regulated signal transduction histidine kinase (bacteriophytochrome)